MREEVKQRVAHFAAAGFKRDLYYRDGDTRPALRGQIFAAMKWQWTTFVRFLLCSFYARTVSASLSLSLALLLPPNSTLHLIIVHHHILKLAPFYLFFSVCPFLSNLVILRPTRALTFFLLLLLLLA